MMLPRASKHSGAIDVQFLRCEVVSRQSPDTNLRESTTDKSPLALRLLSQDFP